MLCCQWKIEDKKKRQERSRLESERRVGGDQLCRRMKTVCVLWRRLQRSSNKQRVQREAVVARWLALAVCRWQAESHTSLAAQMGWFTSIPGNRSMINWHWMANKIQSHFHSFNLDKVALILTRMCGDQTKDTILTRMNAQLTFLPKMFLQLFVFALTAYTHSIFVGTEMICKFILISQHSRWLNIRNK